MALSKGSQLGPYEIQSQIGAGGMGEVYRARDTRLDRTVAVKVSHEQFSERFAREAKVVATLNHPYICTLHDVGPDYLVMEYVDGTPLAGPLPLAEAIEVAGKIAEALDHAHRRGVVHRDLKPANILVTKAGLKLLDFGLAKVQTPVTENDATRTMGLTQQGTILGTPHYMSPEQIEGEEADARSDIFAFGVVLYELLTGQRAFEGKTSARILASVMKDEPSAPPELLGPLEPVLRRCLAKDPDARFQSAADLKWALETVATRAVPQAGAPPSAWNRWLPWAVAAAAVVGSAALLFWPRPVPALQAFHYTMDPPAGMRFGNIFAAGTPSPDGTMVVFAALPMNAGGGKGGAGTTLWLRPTGSLEARPLQGTAGANLPFWSPDGKSIGFFHAAERKLKRVEALGGSAQALCDTTAFEGGTWSDEGVILFSAGGTLYRVPASGGECVRVSSSTGQTRDFQRDPQFLAGGEAFLYRVTGGDENSRGIYAATLGKPDAPVRLIPDAGSKAVYAPPFAGRPGYLLWLRDQTLVAQRFDPAGLKLEGDPVPVVEEVSVGGGGNNLKGAGGGLRGAFWISRNGLLAYRTGLFAGRQERFQMTWIGRDGKQPEPVGPPEEFGATLQMSPDGRRVALSRTVAGNEDIWLYEFERNILSRLTFDPAREARPVWSPDGRYVAYASDRKGKPQIFRKDSGGGGEEERLLDSPTIDVPTDWSRDGRSLLYLTQDSTTADIMILPLEPQNSKPQVFLQTPFNEANARISPDGKWIVYQSDESGRTEVYIRAFPGGPSGRWPASANGGGAPQWRDDGKEIFYAVRTNNQTSVIMAVGIQALADRIVIQQARELFRYRGTAGFGSTRDGQRFLVLEPVELAEEEGNDTSTSVLKIVANWQALVK